MRTRKTLLNSACSVGAYAILFLMTLFTRKMFVMHFDDRLLGYAGVVENLFGLLAVTELGVGSVITYHLYQELGDKSTQRVRLYMSLYRKAYQVIGLVILGVALALLPFLRWVFPDPETDFAAVYVIYGLQVVNTLSTYFLSFRRILYTTEQRGYVCTKIDLVCNMAVNFSRMAIATWFPSYFLYYGVTTVGTLAANLLIAARYRKDYPEMTAQKVTWSDFKTLGMFHDLKTYLVHRMANAVYGSIDNIVISRLLGARLVSCVSNYSTLQIKVTDLLNKVLDGFAAGIGNLVYDKEAKARAERIFWSLDLCSFFLAAFTAVAYFCLFQPFIRIWLGESWLLPMSYLLFFCLNEYIGWNHRMLGSFRGVLGHFEKDMWYMVASAVTNLALSFLLVWKFGIGGVVAATVVAHGLMWLGRCRVVFGLYLPGLGLKYLRKQLFRGLLLAGELALCGSLCGVINARVTLWGGIVALVLDGCVACTLPTALNLALLLPGSDAAYLRERLGEAALKLKERLAK